MNSEHPEKIFIFRGLENEEGKFEHQPLYGSPEVVLAQPGNLKKWKATKLQLPALCPSEQAASFSCGQNCMLAESKKLTSAQLKLFELFDEYNTGLAECLDYCLPTNLFAKQSFAAGKLKLLPLANLSRCKDSSKLTLWMEWEGTKYSFSPFPAVKDFEKKPVQFH